MIKYSITHFKGCKYKFIVEFKVYYKDNIKTKIMEIYSNSDNINKLETNINSKKTDKIISYKIINKQLANNKSLIEEFIY